MNHTKSFEVGYSWSANELLIRGRPLFGEPPLNPRSTGWSLASHHLVFTHRKWFKMNA